MIPDHLGVYYDHATTDFYQVYKMGNEIIFTEPYTQNYDDPDHVLTADEWETYDDATKLHDEVVDDPVDWLQHILNDILATCHMNERYQLELKFAMRYTDIVPDTV